MLLWSLLKIMIFIAIVVGVVFGIDYLTGMDNLGLLIITGREFVITPFLAVVGALVLLLAVWILFKVVGLLVATLRFLNGDETAVSRYFDRRSERKGYEALGEGMMALAAGEGRLAIRKAERAGKYLGRPELTNLVVAQGAQMVGDDALATETFKAMVADDRTRFVGVRGLMQQKLDAGDTDTALKLAEKALALRPKNADVQTTLISLQSRNEDWAGARGTLAAALKAGNVPRDLHRRRDAVLALAHARDAMAEGQVVTATRDVAEANRLAPGLVPAAVMAARIDVEAGRKRHAVKVIRKAWDQAPHPDLAAAFALIEPDETPALRLRRFRPLLGKHPGHPEVRMLEAELHIANEDFPAARKALGDLAETAPTARSLTIMAAVERGEGSPDRVVRGWLARAVTAPRGNQWMCSSCGHVHEDWTPVCANCESFDTLEWAEARQSQASLVGPTQMLPLIVGALEDQSDADEAEVVAEDIPEAENITPAEPEDAEVTEDAETEAQVSRN
ncbi:tetratricopeptide repeat protein [Rhodobacteraceae bacterium N5(2021)]|uniref:Tetratricopeptide repeat protein n=1 Tax=Gymnodinialimonas phycosphaerae TaxID=2841589 RepID=A0A975YEV2_9RHOB|nr:heme biosynthesis HemY N-terminal domain-containing protein [Gymnodinialimonas phycosphaerae]MBY4894003.1 tetratricopeptide repeat protein [Gymnodinialimonas phycosphaerae]